MADQAKKSNIYKVVTSLPTGAALVEIEGRMQCINYVRAKTRAGAVAIVAAEHVSAEIANVEELAKLAKIAVKGGA